MQGSWTALSLEGLPTSVRNSGEPSPSPFSFPTHIRCRETGSSLAMELRYVDGEEPTLESDPTGNGVVVAVGRITGRLRGIYIRREWLRGLLQELPSIEQEAREDFISKRVEPLVREALDAFNGLRRQPTELNRQVVVGALAPTIEHCVP